MLLSIIYIQVLLSSDSESSVAGSESEQYSDSEFEESLSQTLAKNINPTILTRLLNEEACKSIDVSDCQCNPADLFAQKDFTTFDYLHALIGTTESEGHCSICMESGNLVFPPSCKLGACAGCWTKHFDSLDAPRGLTNSLKDVHCLCRKCEPAEMEPVVYKTASGKFKAKRDDLRLFQYACHLQYRPCVNGNCDLFLRETDFCFCGSDLCVECGQRMHPGVSCEILKEYLEGDGDDSLALIRDLTKNCPKCHTPIMKKEGCNHMTCTQCNTQFCWFCFRLNCGSFDCKANSRSAIDAMKQKEQSLHAKHAEVRKIKDLYEQNSKYAELIRKELEIGQNSRALYKDVYLAFRTISSAYLTIGNLKLKGKPSEQLLQDIKDLEDAATRGIVKEKSETTESYYKRVAETWKTQSTEDKWGKLQKAQTIVESTAHIGTSKK